MSTARTAALALAALAVGGSVAFYYARSTAPTQAVAMSPSPSISPSPSVDVFSELEDIVDEVRDQYGFYGKAKDRYFEAIAWAFIDDDCERLATIIDLWENPPAYASRYVRELPQEQRDELIAAAEKARALLFCF